MMNLKLLSIDEFDSLKTGTIELESFNDEDISFVVANEPVEISSTQSFYFKSLKKIYVEEFGDNDCYDSVSECICDASLEEISGLKSKDIVKKWMRVLNTGNKFKSLRQLLDKPENIQNAFLLEESDESLSVILTGLNTRYLVFVL